MSKCQVQLGCLRLQFFILFFCMGNVFSGVTLEINLSAKMAAYKIANVWDPQWRSYCTREVKRINEVQERHFSKDLRLVVGLKLN